MKPAEKGKKPIKSSVLPLIAGILIIVNATLLGAAAIWFPWVIPILPGSAGNDVSVLLTISTVGFVSGFLVLFGALMLRINPTNRKTWSLTVIVFSISSIITGGGLIVGFILGIIGGARELKQKHMLGR